MEKKAVLSKERLTAPGVDVTFSGRPSSLVTLWKAFRNGAGKPEPGETPVIPQVRTLRSGVGINGKHLKSYSGICGAACDETLPVLYPLMLIYPFNLRIISLKEIPLSMFSMLNTRTVVTASRPISADEILDIVCEVSGSRIVEKGFETDIRSALSIAGNTVWECVKTFYFRGRFGEADSPEKKNGLRPIPDGPADASWYLPAGNGFRFAKISGDSNGIHYSRRYAGIMGFKRDFAQPMMITGTCLEMLGRSHPPSAVRLDFLYKGQVYYESRLHLRRQHRDGSERFDLYCEGNSRPCICGEIRDF